MVLPCLLTNVDLCLHIFRMDGLEQVTPKVFLALRLSELLLLMGPIGRGCHHIHSSARFGMMQDYSRTEVGKLQPRGHIWPIACFCTSNKLKMIFTFLKELQKNKEEYVTDHMWLTKPNIDYLAFYRNSLRTSILEHTKTVCIEDLSHLIFYKTLFPNSAQAVR